MRSLCQQVGLNVSTGLLMEGGSARSRLIGSRSFGSGFAYQNISRISLRETGLQKAESEAMPEQRSQVTEATRTFVLLQIGVRIDLGESRIGSRVAQRQSQAGVPNELIDE
jgi:hypothetical protein